MKLFNIKYAYSFLFLVVCVLSFTFQETQAQTVSPDALHVTSVGQYEVYPYYQELNLGAGIPGLCVIGSFYSQTSTKVGFRYTPLFSAQEAGWNFAPFTATINPPSGGINSVVGLNTTPETEYVVQAIELDEEGIYHDITPSLTSDSIKTSCTPNANGNLSPDCPQGSFVVTECSPTGVNQAMQNAGSSNGPLASVSGIQEGEAAGDFILTTQNVPIGEYLTIVYSTDQQAITSGNFGGLSNISVEIVASQQTPINIPGLLPNSTYYMTVLDVEQVVLLVTSSNQPYETFSTAMNTNNGGGGGQGSGNGGGGGQGSGTGTISVNIGDFNSPQLTGEEIQNGLVQCGNGEFYDCDFNALLATIDRILKFLIYIIALPIAAILFAIAGIKLIIAKAQAKQAALSDAKAMIGKVILGLVFALAAWVIVKFILIILGYNDPLVTQILGISLGQ